MTFSKRYPKSYTLDIDEWDTFPPEEAVDWDEEAQELVAEIAEKKRRRRLFFSVISAINSCSSWSQSTDSSDGNVSHSSISNVYDFGYLLENAIYSPKLNESGST